MVGDVYRLGPNNLLTLFPGYAGPRSRDDRAASAETAAGKRCPEETTDTSQGVTTSCARDLNLAKHLNNWVSKYSDKIG